MDQHQLYIFSRLLINSLDSKPGRGHGWVLQLQFMNQSESL